MTHPSYRRDIDGLRAVAVLSVVGFHAFKAALPGGFIGVDVFFVISGYLICGIILSRVAGNRLDLPAFYARRINRIFPALTLVLACCLVAGSVYMYADEFAELRRHIRAGAFFYANFTLHAEADYWDRASEFKPLLHLWSLAIEEQFYIVFPLLIYVLAKCRVNLTLALVAMIAGSFALNVTRVYSSALDSFYSPHRRFWELLLGGLLAQIEMTGGLSAFFPERFSGWSARSGALVPTVAGAAGVLLIVGGASFMSGGLPFPGYWALVPTGGALLIIAAGRRGWVNQKVLGHGAMVWVGLISYPLYLWHWPLLSFLRIIRNGEAAALERAVAVALSAALAWMTYRFLETPIRSGRHRLPPPLVLAPLLVALAVSTSLNWRVHHDSSEFAQLIVRPAVPRWTPVAGLRIAGQPRTAIFVGDSHANQYQPRVSHLIAEDPAHTRSAIFFATGSCLPIPHVKRASEPQRACEDEVSLRQALHAVDTEPSIDTVVLSASWKAQFEYPDLRYEENGRAQYVDEPGAVTRMFSSLESMIGALRQQGKRVFVVLDNPRNVPDAFIDPRQLVVRHFIGPLSLRPNNVVRRQAVLASQEPVRQLLVAAAYKGGATIIDPVQFLCAADVCPVITETGDPIYTDGNHIHPSYMQHHVTYLDAVLRGEREGTPREAPRSRVSNDSAETRDPS